MKKNIYTDIFSHNLGVITSEEQEKLKHSKIAVAGVGGVGGNSIYMLARAGVGNFKIADPDTFSYGNINRQCGATLKTVDKKKVDVIEELLISINAEVNIEKYPDGLTEENIEEFIDGTDVVLDGVDFLEPKIRKQLIKSAQRAGIYTFLAPALGFGASLVVFSPDGISYDEFFGGLSGKVTPEALFNFARKIFPVLPAYVDKDAYVKGMDNSNHIPTFSGSVMLASTMEVLEVVFFILGRRPPVCVPNIRWIDLLEGRLETINVLEGNAHENRQI